MDEAQSRPSPMCASFEVCDSHGWPSSGPGRFVLFFASYFTLLCLLDGAGASSPGSGHLLALLTWPAAFLTLCSRVYLGCHAVAQVIASATLGMVLGAGWFWIVNTIFAYCFPAIEEKGIGRFLYI